LLLGKEYPIFSKGKWLHMSAAFHEKIYPHCCPDNSNTLRSNEAAQSPRLLRRREHFTSDLFHQCGRPYSLFPSNGLCRRQLSDVYFKQHGFSLANAVLEAGLIAAATPRYGDQLPKLSF